VPAHAVELRGAQIEKLSFDKLDGWRDDNHAAAFAAYMKSCGAILHADTAARRKKPMLGGLYNACVQAKIVEAAGPVDRTRARKFFEDNFKPMRVLPGQRTYGFYTGADGFYTGYYEPEVVGSRKPTDDFKVPLYGSPKSKAGKVLTQYDRKEIEEGALDGKGLEICYVKNSVDAFFAQIQGSTRIKLDDGTLLRLNYIASNGQKYYPVGKDLIDRGIIAKQDMSMDRIRQWMEANPAEGKELREKNHSYVFFEKTPLAPDTQIVGAQGVPLTPLRSVAVDKSLHVYGTPIWIDANLPLESEEPATPFRRLVIAQDTGSAIVGPARADIFFGAGHNVEHVAGRLKDHGEFVMLVPKSVELKGDSGPADIPLPLARPPEIATRTAEAVGSAR